MDTDRDTFLTAVYTTVDTILQTEILPHTPVRPGPVPIMRDSEVLTLELIGPWRGSSERDLLRWADAELRPWFPVQLSQSAFNRRCRDLAPCCAELMVILADQLGADQTPSQILDTTPVPLARQCRGARRRLFTETQASVGRGGSDHTWFYGCRLLLAVAADGPITGCVLSPAATQDRWDADALLTWRTDPAGHLWTVDDLPRGRRHRRGGGGYTGPTGLRWWPGSVGHHHATGVYVADQGFGGQAWLPHWRADTGAEVLPGDPPESLVRRAHHGWRQMIETINEQLADVMHLAFPLAKTIWGVVTRVVAKCTAVNVGIWVNRWSARPDMALTTLFTR